MSGAPWIVIGEHLDERGRKIPVGFPLEDLRGHASILGTTGSGKSTLLRNLALQAFDLGATTIVFEPHGDLILHPEEGILAALPSAVLDRVVVVDLTGARPVQINLLAAGLEAGRSLAVDMTMRCIRVVEDASWSVAVQMREILEHASHLLLDVLGARASIVHLLRFLTDRVFQNEMLAQASPDVIESFLYWQRLGDKAKRGKAPDLDVPIRRVSKLLRDEHLRRSLSLPELGQGIDLGKILDSRTPMMILVPLRSADLGEDGKRILGTLLLQQLLAAFLTRQAHQRQQVVVIIDELADLAGGEAGYLTRQLLAQARKFGASILLAAQSLAQLPGEVKQEVRTNTNIKIVLATAGPEDGREAIKNLGDEKLAAADVMEIERFHGYARVLVNGERQPVFYFRTIAPIWPLGEVAAARLSNETLNKPEVCRTAGRDPEPDIAEIVGMPQADFDELVSSVTNHGKQQANLLQINASFPMDKTRRAQEISALQHGVPWWLLEAHYRRIRFQ